MYFIIFVILVIYCIFDKCLTCSRGANAGRGRSPAGMSRSRATGAIGTTAKGFRNGRAAGRMSRENRSSSRSASRSSSSASSSSAADSDSPRKRRRVGDRRFDRYDDSDAERAARRTRRPRPLASVKDILAKTGDQAAFRSNKTPVKLTLSRNKVIRLRMLTIGICVYYSIRRLYLLFPQFI